MDFNKTFDFNYIKESVKSIHMGFNFDDLDNTDDKLPTLKKNIRSKTEYNIYNFQALIRHLLYNLDLSDDTIDNMFNTGDIACNTHTNQNDQVRHFMCCFIYHNNSTKDDLQMVVDYCENTKSLILAVLSEYRVSTTKWFNVSYPLIKMISGCNTDQYKIYIGQIYRENSWRYSNSPDKVINQQYANGLDISDFMSVSESCSFFRGKWDNKTYYLPDTPARYKKVKKNWPKDLIIPHSFFNCFGGFLSKHTPISDDHVIEDSEYTLLYKEMFESDEDFKTMVKILCEANYPVYDQTANIKYTSKNYLQLLGLSDSQEGSESSEDKEYREKLEKLLGEPVVNAFKDVLLYDPMLKVNSLYKERVSEKNIYKKFNDAIVEKILLDNGIDLNKLLVESTNRAKEIFKKIFDINIKLCKYGDFADYLQYGHSKYTYEKEYDQLIYDLRNEIGELSKSDEAELYNYCTSKGYNINNLDITFICGYYNEYVVAPYNKLLWQRCMSPKDKLIVRFYYLLANRCYDDVAIDGNATIQQIISPDDSYFILATRYNNDAFGGGTIYNLGNINYTINTYKSLYKFCTYIAYAIENAYNDIKRLNFSTLPYHQNSPGDVINWQAQFTEDTPDMNTFNTNTLSKCLTTIFTNIASKKEKQK